MAAKRGGDKGVKRQGTALADALTPGPAGDLASTIESHRRVVLRIWEEQGPRKAFNALIRASLPLPMTLRTASLMVRLAKVAGTHEAAGTLLEAALEDEESPKLRERLHRQLARLWFSVDQPERGREALEAALAEAPTPPWRLERMLGRDVVRPSSRSAAKDVDVSVELAAAASAEVPAPIGASGADALAVLPGPAGSASGVDSVAPAQLKDGPGDDAREDAPSTLAGQVASGTPAHVDAASAHTEAEGPRGEGAEASEPSAGQAPRAHAAEASTPDGADLPRRDGDEAVPTVAAAGLEREDAEGGSAATPATFEDLPEESTPADARALAEELHPPSPSAPDAPASHTAPASTASPGAPGLDPGDVTPADAQRPLAADPLEVTPADAQRPLAADPLEVTPADAQRPPPADNLEVTPADAQRPLPTDPLEVTPADAQPLPVESLDVTPSDAQRPLPTDKLEVTPADAQPLPVESLEVTPADAHRPLPPADDEVTPAESQRPVVEDESEVTPAAARRLELDEVQAPRASPTAPARPGGRGKATPSRPKRHTPLETAVPSPPMEEVPWVVGDDDAPSQRLSTDLFKILAQPPVTPPRASSAPVAPMGIAVRPPRKRGHGTDGRRSTRPEIPSHDDVTPAEATPLKSEAEPEGPGMTPAVDPAAAGRAKANWNEVTRPSAEHAAVSGPLIALPPGAKPPPADEVTHRAELPPELAAQQISRALAARPTLRHGHTADVMDAPAFTDPGTILRKEAGFVARGNWSELAAFYRRRAERAASSEERAEYQARLAELLETELGDAQAAAAVYGELVAAGEDFALSEQLRLLEASKDRAGARRALDNAVLKAATPEAETAALVTRGEWLLAIGEWSEAQEDFQTALSGAPDHVRALLGWTEARLHTGTQASLKPLKDHLARVPERHPERAQALKRLALLADSLGERDVGGWAWRELYAETPADEEAARRVLEIAREQGDKNSLEALLRASLQKQPRGEEARRRREELWTLLESLGREAEALTEMRHAGRSEPGHREAWVALFERMEARGSYGEAAWALEQAATATEDETLREETWRRLARFTEQRLTDPAKAERFTARADAMKELREAAEAARAEAEAASRAEARGDFPVVTAPARRSAAHPAIAKPAAPPPRLGATEHTFAGAVRGPGEATSLHQLRASGATSAQVRKSFGGGPSPSRGPALPRIRRPGEPTPVPAPTAHSPIPPASALSPQVSASSSAATRIVETPEDPAERAEQVLEGPTGAALPRPTVPRAATLLEVGFRRVREEPLHPEGYRNLAEGFSVGGDGARSLLMVELARALEGEVIGPSEAPQLELGAADRAGLRHPALRGEAGELLAAVGHAFCRLFPTEEHDFRGEPFRLDSGRGASAATEALLASVRVLGLRAADVSVSEEPGPPFGVVRPDAPMIMVGRMAVQRILPAAELRFFAGRALMSQEPDLLVLRGLRREQVVHALSVLGWALTGTSTGDEVARVRDALSLQTRQRLELIYPRVSEDLRFPVLADGARDSANRAGLVTCGAVGPALAALRSKKALEREMAELLRFAASERYFQLRQRALGRK